MNDNYTSRQILQIIDTHKLSNGNFKLDESISNILGRDWRPILEDISNPNYGWVSANIRYSNNDKQNETIDAMVNTFGIDRMPSSVMEGECDVHYLSYLIYVSPGNEFVKHDVLDYIYGYDRFHFEYNEYIRRTDQRIAVYNYTQSKNNFVNVLTQRGCTNEDILNLEHTIYRHSVDVRNFSAYKDSLKVQNEYEYQRRMTNEGLQTVGHNFNVCRTIVEDCNINDYKQLKKEVKNMCKINQLSRDDMANNKIDNRYGQYTNQN